MGVGRLASFDVSFCMSARIMADMENALWGADRVVSNEEPINHDFVTVSHLSDQVGVAT